MKNFSIPIDSTDMNSLLFRIKKFEYNTYKIEHPSAKGFLRVCNIPVNILKISDEKLNSISTHVKPIPDNMKYVINYQGIVGFVNQGKKLKITESWLPQYVDSKRKQDLFAYIQLEQNNEPWNEFIVQGENPLLIRTKTTLTNAYLYPGYANNLGDPIIHAMYNTSISISTDSNPEAGMT